jgi:hypothetical protein
VQKIGEKSRNTGIIITLIPNQKAAFIIDQSFLKALHQIELIYVIHILMKCIFIVPRIFETGRKVQPPVNWPNLTVPAHEGLVTVG